ncbi:MAG TPA: acyltransferase [Ruminiclostridium sp.]|nr:acyltransferase [Ruminiclostridium sp.]
MTKKNYSSIDIAKFLCAFLIIPIHVFPSFASENGVCFSFLNIICRYAVPLFFVFSGFFLGSKDLKDYSNIKKYIKRIGILYLCWSLIYIPFVIHDFLIGQTEINAYVVREIQSIFFAGTYYHLWFFTSLIYAAFLIFILNKSLPPKVVWIILGILFIIGAFGDSYYSLSQYFPAVGNAYNSYLGTFLFTRNGIFLTPIYLYAGIRIRQREISLPRSKSIIGFAVSSILVIIEALIINQKHLSIMYGCNFYFFMIPAAIFALLILKDINVKERKCYITMRKCSVIIYAVHVVFLNLLYIFISYRFVAFHSTAAFIIISLLSFVTSFIIVKLSETRFGKFLKVLY